MSSQMGNDGSYTLTVTFDIGTDVNTALVMVQNRVALAMPQLPTRGPEPGDHDPQEDPRYPDDRQLLLAGRPLRRHLPEQLRHDLRQGRAAARLRGLGHQLHGPARLQHPRLARPAEAGVAQHDRHGCGQRDPQRELDAPAGQIGQTPCLPGSAVPVADRYAGPAHRSRAVRIDRGQGQPESTRRSRRPASSASATWPASSWALRTTTSPAPSTATRRWASPSTSSPEPMRSTSPTGCEPRWRSSKPAFRTGWTTTSPTTRLRSSASRSTRSSRPCATRCSWSASSCSCSCRTGGP